MGGLGSNSAGSSRLGIRETGADLEPHLGRTPAPLLSQIPDPHRPVELDKFWTQTASELAGVEPEPEFAREPGELPGTNIVHFSFNSLNGARIGGYLIDWDDAESRPLVVHSHGYGSPGADIEWQWAAAGLRVAGIDVRGYGRSASALSDQSPWGYILSGIDSAQTSVLRGAVCDLWRGCEVALEKVGNERVSQRVLHGWSFSGGLATIVQALSRFAELLVLAVPSLGWTAARRALAEAGSGAEIDAYLSRYPDREAQTLEVLSHFDAANFAELIECPAVIGIGTADAVVPPEAVMAIASRMRGPKELIQLPQSHTDGVEERLWQGFEQHWLNRVSDA